MSSAGAIHQDKLIALSMPLTPLTGREREIQSVTGALNADARLVVLTGSGGVGKTHLAPESAATLESAFPDGFFTVSLASIENRFAVCLPKLRHGAIPATLLRS